MSEVNKRFRLGWILVIVGIFLLLNNFDLIPGLPHYIWSWQMLLIVIGAFTLIVNKNNRGGAILILVGFFFLIPDILDLNWREYRGFWPILLVIVGILFILNRRTKTSSESSVDFIDELAILGGGDRKITSQNFSGGKITTFMGGMDLDMSDAKLGKGKQTIEVFTMFGGTDMRVPADWPVTVNVTSILGGYSDERKNPKVAESIDSDQLVIKGFTMFGGGTVKS